MEYNSCLFAAVNKVCNFEYLSKYGPSFPATFNPLYSQRVQYSPRAAEQPSGFHGD